MYINNCTTNLKNPLMLYADDCKLLGLAQNNLNLSTMQEDLDRLSRWSSDWCLQFNALKCKVLHLGHNNPKLAYHIGDAQLEAVSEEKDLGVIVDNELKFHCHTRAQVAKANQALGLIKQTFTTRKSGVITKLYKAMVRPHLEFGMTLASPYYKMDVKVLESVQRRATKLISAFQDKSYKERLTLLKLPTLVYRRKRGDVIATRKLLENDLLSHVFSPSFSTTTRGHTKKLQAPRCIKQERQQFFSVRSVPLWNSLSKATQQSKTLDTFKKGVDQDWANAEWRLNWDVKS